MAIRDALALSEDSRALQDTLRGFLTDHLPSARLRAARYTQQVMAAQARAGEPPGPEIALNKLALSANMNRLAEFVADVLGPALIADTGAWGTYAWTSVVLGAPGYRLGGGTDEVLKNAIAQRVLGLPRPA